MAEWLDYDAIKQIPIRSVLHRYGIEANGRNLKCPLPTHTSQKVETSFSIKDNFWVCWSPSCQSNREGKKGGDVIHFVMAKESVDRATAGRMLAEWFAIPGNQNSPPKAEHKSSKPAVPDPLPSGNKPLSFAGLKDINPEHPMIQGRGITAETAKEFGVGFFPGKGSMVNRIVFPLHEDGVLVGYAGRATVEGQDPKWLLGKGLVKSFLYGLERCNQTKPIVVVESFWAVLWFWQKGTQAAALMGSEMTEAQEECLEPFDTIVVALDNDAAGNTKAAPIVERLRKNHRVIKARLVE